LRRRRRLAGAGPAAPLPPRDRAPHRRIHRQCRRRGGARRGGVRAKGMTRFDLQSDEMRPDRHLAELNIGRVRYPLGDPRMAGFVDNLDRVNGIADRSEGFVWRLKDESGNNTNLRAFDDPLIIANVSVWESPEALERYVWQTVHKRFYGHRHEWFEKM